MTNKPPNNITDHDRQQAIIAAECEAKRIAARDKNTFWVIIIVLGLGMVSYVRYTEHQKEVIKDNLVSTKWAKWVAYRDANCKPVEQMFGLVVGHGKFQSVDNATVYECTSGMRYLISRNAEQNILACRGDPAYIPDVPPIK